MRVATPQRTADRRCVVPTPTIAPVIVCVVLTGIPGQRRAEQRDGPRSLRRRTRRRASAW